jgi:CheY-like chemotaxis protein
LASILLVEDDEGNREALRELLEGEGYKVATAADGAAALMWLRAGARPDLILLDLMMPVMNGTEFRAHQRRDPQLADIPVVLMSAGAHLDAEGALLGVSLVIGKPPDVSAMLRELSRLVAEPALPARF